jgi:hypothetical protein
MIESSAMHHEQRDRNVADAIDGAVLIDHDDAERKPLPHQLPNIDGRGERRLGMSAWTRGGRKPCRDSSRSDLP